MTHGKGAVARRILVAAAAAVALVAPVAVAAPTANAAGSVISAVSLSAPSAAQYGTPINLTGTVWRYGTQVRIAGAPIVLQRSVHGANRWANYKSTRSASNGTFAFSVTQTLAYDYRAYYPGSTVYRAALSGVRFPVVIQRLFLDGLATVDYEAGVLRAVGRAYPTPPSGSPVYLQRYDAASRTYKTFAGTRTNGTNKVVISGRVGASTGWYRIYAPQRSVYGAAASVGKQFTHYVWRGVFRRPVLATGGGGQFHIDTTDPGRFSADVSAAPNGTAWADIATAGCLAIDGFYDNFESEAYSARYYNGASLLAAAAVPADNEDSIHFGIDLRGLSRVRIQLIDTGANSGLDAGIDVAILCNT